MIKEQMGEIRRLMKQWKKNCLRTDRERECVEGGRGGCGGNGGKEEEEDKKGKKKRK